MACDSPNGNILSLDRKGVASQNLRMDEMDYEYETIANGYAKNTNRLKRVTDDVPNGNYEEDIDNQLEEENYQYDKIGNLIRDESEGLTITWNVQGKVKTVAHDTDKGDDLEFRYDATGNRIVKIVKPHAGGGQVANQDKWKYTYYQQDASGNTMAVYKKSYENLGTNSYKEVLSISDFHMYGSERLGTYTPKEDDKQVAERTFAVSNINADGTFEEEFATTQSSQMAIVDNLSHYVGNRSYEGKNHLGNVLVVFTDAKGSFDRNNDGLIDAYQAVVVSASDYYPFGSPMPNRKFSGVSYRYGFNGMEKDDEFTSSTSHYDFGARIYDSRLGRWLSLDPLFKKFSFLTPYHFANNNPIYYKDSDGEEYIAGNEDAKTQTLAAFELAFGTSEGFVFDKKGKLSYNEEVFNQASGELSEAQKKLKTLIVDKIINAEDVKLTVYVTQEGMAQTNPPAKTGKEEMLDKTKTKKFSIEESKTMSQDFENPLTKEKLNLLSYQVKPDELNAYLKRKGIDIESFDPNTPIISDDVFRAGVLFHEMGHVIGYVKGYSEYGLEGEGKFALINLNHGYAVAVENLFRTSQDLPLRENHGKAENKQGDLETPEFEESESQLDKLEVETK